MTIRYIADGIEKTASQTNGDLEITENSAQERQTVYIKAKNALQLVAAETDFAHAFSDDDRIFLNGWQSWTDSFEYSWNDKLKDALKLPGFLNSKYAFPQYGDAYFYQYHKDVLHTWDVSYIKGKNPLFVGNLNYKTAFITIEYRKKQNTVTLKSDVAGITLKEGSSLCIFDYIKGTDVEQTAFKYFDHFKKPHAKKLLGYTSWYNHYQNINEQLIFDALENVPDNFDLFQIDDGFETFVGDWFSIDKNKFPSGLAPVVEKIHARGFMAGIWLAPFVAEEKSELFKNHPDWFVKDPSGTPLKAGGNWSGFYALDLSNPKAEQYVRDVISFYKQTGFDFFKLDFLYAASILPLAGLSRAQTASKAYALLREVLGDKLILGCGAVISSSFEVFDYLRIGPDVSLIFDDVWYMRLLHRERISTKITLQNTIYRHLFNGNVFLNDPDVFLLPCLDGK